MAAETCKAANTEGGRNPFLFALADALAGALGGVVAVLAFYPVDIAKTRAQAHRDVPDGSRDNLLGSSEKRNGWFSRSRTLAALLLLIHKEGPWRVFEGIEAKALQSLVASFVYFYAYAFIKGVLRRRAGGSLSPSLNLLAAAVAGTVNQTFTLPLENITTRMQTASAIDPNRNDSSDESGKSGLHPRSSDGSKEDISTLRGGGGTSGTFVKVSSGDPQQRQDMAPTGTPRRSSERREVRPTDGNANRQEGVSTSGDSVSPDAVTPSEAETSEGARAPEAARGVPFPRGAPHTAPSNSTSTPRIHRDEAPEHDRKSRYRRPRQSFFAVAAQLYREGGGIGRFWRGFAPSLILTCNPAINFTAFDLVKQAWLRRRAAVQPAGVASPTGGFLNPVEAFLIAAAAKSLATLVTYPLIRAKVILMTASSRRLERDVASKGGQPDDPVLEGNGRAATAGAPAGGEGVAAVDGDGDRVQGGVGRMARVLVDIVRHEGFGGLYVGCGAQLLYTILKSALLLATKEEIARVASSAVFLGDTGARRLAGSGDLVSKNEPIRAGGGRGVC